MNVSDFLKHRNFKIIERYRELKAGKIPSSVAKKMISKEYSISVSTIDQILYNKKYSNSPHKE